MRKREKMKEEEKDREKVRRKLREGRCGTMCEKAADVVTCP